MFPLFLPSFPTSLPLIAGYYCAAPPPKRPPFWTPRHPHTHIFCHAGGVTLLPSFSLCIIGGEQKQKEEEKKKSPPVTSQDVRPPRCLPTGRPLIAAHLPPNPPAAVLPLPEGGQSGLGEGEEAATAWRAAQPTAHQTHPHILSVSGRDSFDIYPILLCIISYC